MTKRTLPFAAALTPLLLAGLATPASAAGPAPKVLARDAGSKQQCDPNYSDCVPIASDVDCASGSGNGPAYVGYPVQVIGTDIYRLDNNGDGIGCEQG